MAHLLVIELPGGNDFDLLEAACAQGHSYSFASGRLAHYRQQPQVWPWVARANQCIDINGLGADALQNRMRTLHAQAPWDAVLCLIDIRIIDAALIAQALGLPFLNPKSAVLLRDKYAVRAHLQAQGIAQPPFALACNNEDLQAAVHTLGLPVLIKPVDGFGSQNIVLLRDPGDLDPLLTPLDTMLPSGVQYGLGVAANDRLLVERWMPGTVVACDTFSRNGQHLLLGTNEKMYFDPPSFAIRGGCFTPWRGQDPALQAYVFALLDAVGFDWGAAHVELMMTDTGPQLIEINPRLVGAKIARLMSLAWALPIHALLIDLHLGRPIDLPPAPHNFAATQWVNAAHSGVFSGLREPAFLPAEIRCFETVKATGDTIGPPMDNADRIAYVMACAPSPEQAQKAALDYVQACEVIYQSPGG